MAGIYLHIPFCHRACHYCDFHFSTNLRNVDELIDAMVIELDRKQHWLEDKPPIRTIYFGGGTPSILQSKHLGSLFEAMAKHYDLSELEECTLEANPEDLSSDYLASIEHTPINRFSIGIQSFRDEDLQWMNRLHTSEQAIRSIKTAQDAGFDKLTVDLIYGLPNLSLTDWRNNLDQIDELGINHLSAYGLTVESETPLGYKVSKGMEPPTDDVLMSDQFDLLMDWADDHGYEHYEISNFAKVGQRSVHNSNYWNGIPYLGIGPGAHGFNGRERSANVRSNLKYIQQVDRNEDPATIEHLSSEDHLNELILTQLRRIEGLSYDLIKKTSGSDSVKEIIKLARPLIAGDLLSSKDNHLILTRKGKHLADYVASRLFL